MKIAIAGCGKVGAALTEQLTKEKHDVTIIDQDESRMAYVTDSQDVMTYVGDARSVSVLKNAGVDTCDLMLAMTDDDEVNLVICLVANKIGVKRTIARVRNPIFRDTMPVIEDELGLSMVVNPDLEAAREMFNSLYFKAAGQVESFAKSRNQIFTCALEPDMSICNTQIMDLYSATKARVFICAIKREEEVFIPNGETKLLAGDTLSFVASHKEAEKFFKRIGRDTGRVRNLTIIGGGRLGFYLGRMAVENGIPLKVVEKNEETCKTLNVALPSADIICGDATLMDVLEEEGVLDASAIATLTGSDSVNVLLSMYLKRKSPNAKLITKIKSSDFEEMLYNLDVGSVYNPKYIAADHVLRYVRAMQNVLENEVQSLCHVIDNKVEVLEFLIGKDAPFIGTPIKDLKLKNDLLVTDITRGGRSFIPGGNDTIEAGDSILVVTTMSGLYRIRDIFE